VPGPVGPQLRRQQLAEIRRCHVPALLGREHQPRGIPAIACTTIGGIGTTRSRRPLPHTRIVSPLMWSVCAPAISARRSPQHAASRIANRHRWSAVASASLMTISGVGLGPPAGIGTVGSEIDGSRSIRPARTPHR
jgi:hypothetical protein